MNTTDHRKDQDLPPPSEPVFQDHPRALYVDMTDQEFAAAVYQRLFTNISKYAKDPQVVRG